MSFGICFYFEDSDRDMWSGHQTDLDAWRYTLKAWGGNRLAMIDLVEGGSGMGAIDESIEFSTYKTLDGFLAEEVGETIVYVDARGTALSVFQHPENCWYVFGPAGGFVQAHNPAVAVEQRTDLNLHAVHIAPVVIWHRYAQQTGLI